MNQKELLFKEIEGIPELYFDKILDFIKSLKKKNTERNFDLAIASESSLKKDWLKPEEDEAWQNL